MELLNRYKNGNTVVSIFDDGTKVRSVPDTGEAIADFPESIDLKITNYCDMGCKYCFEASTTDGVHGSVQWILDTLYGLPAGVEIAIGGGNPLDYPVLTELLKILRRRGLLCNLTVNGGHLQDYGSKLAKLVETQLIRGLGISWSDSRKDDVLEWSALPNSVIHTIAGVTPLRHLLEVPKDRKVLVLGYKNYGFGKHFARANPVADALVLWKDSIGEVMNRFEIVSFDNLALEQLNIKSLVPDSVWNTRYLGGDGLTSMYLDAVKETYAKSSTSKRIPSEGRNVKDLFKSVQSDARAEAGIREEVLST